MNKGKTRNWIIGGIVLVLIVAAGAVAVWKGVTMARGTVGTSDDPIVIDMKPASITRSVAQDYYNQLKDDYESQGYDVTDAAILTDIKTSALTALAQRRIADDKIESMSLGSITQEDRDKAKADAQKEYDDAVDLYAQFFQNEEGTLTEEECKAAVRQYFTDNSISVDQLTEYYVSDIPTQRLLDTITKDVTVSHIEIAARYQEMADSDKATYENDIPNYEVDLNYYGTDIVYQPAGYRGIRHILLATPKEIQTKLDELQAELNQLTEDLFYLQNPDRHPGDNLTLPTPPPEVTPEPTATPEPDTKAIAEKQTAIDAKTAEIEALRATIVDELAPTIEEIKSKIANGESFLSLIDEYNVDPGMEEEPQRTIGYPVHAQSILYDDAFQQGAMALSKVGDISEPILSSFGVHILEYTSDMKEGAVEMTSKRSDDIKAEILQTKQNKAVDDQFAIWMKDYNVVLHPEYLN